MAVYDKFEKEAFNITLNRNLNNNVITKAQFNEYLKQHEDSVIKFTDKGGSTKGFIIPRKFGIVVAYGYAVFTL